MRIFENHGSSLLSNSLESSCILSCAFLSDSSMRLKVPTSSARWIAALFTLFCKPSALSFFCKNVVLSDCKFCKIPRTLSNVAFSKFAEFFHGSSFEFKSSSDDVSASASSFAFWELSRISSSKFCCCVAKPSKARWTFSISPLILRNLAAKSLRRSAPFSTFAESSQERCSREPQTGQGSPGFKVWRSSATTTGMSSWIMDSFSFCNVVKFARAFSRSEITPSNDFCLDEISPCKRTDSL